MGVPISNGGAGQHWTPAGDGPVSGAKKQEMKTFNNKSAKKRSLYDACVETKPVCAEWFSFSTQ